MTLKKLAVVISGAVSLGSYEAGVMYEILEAIAIHNQSATDKIEIDIITGASAGGMTACILAQHLLCGDQPSGTSQNQSLRKAYDNPLYNAWVRAVDIKDLIVVDSKEQRFSLLDTTVVNKIGNNFLKQEVILREKHSSVSANIYVGIAMSNLNGYGYSVNTSQIGSQGQFTYTRYKDQFICNISRKENREILIEELDFIQGKNKKIELTHLVNSSWESLRDVGLSSGAFPFAFKVKEVERFGSKDKSSRREAKLYTYTDGGVFENEPIGLAKKIADFIDDENTLDQRSYLYIAPGVRENPRDIFEDFKEKNIINIGRALVSAVFNQARFQDWITEEISQEIFTITATDSQLIGDTFSAFAGFLEEKFRAYDYNIGRESARLSLLCANEAKYINFELAQMPPIEWRTQCKLGSINFQESSFNEAGWKLAKQELQKFAVPILDNNERNQLKELRELMKEVDIKKRKLILKELLTRTDSLVDFINNYLDEMDKKVNSQKNIIAKFNRLRPRKWLISPILKYILKSYFRKWLKSNVLEI